MDPRETLRARPMSLAQMGIVLICMLINMIDGYDILALAQAAPTLNGEWLLPPERLGMLFSAGLAGMAIGALAVSPIADQAGRRPAILLCLCLMSLGMAGAALSNGFWTMGAARLVTGVGIGGMTATAGTLALEYASFKRRELCSSLVAASYPVGNIIGGSVAIALLDAFGWRGIFWAGMMLSAVLLPIALVWLPESLDFLVARQPKGALSRTNAVLARLRVPLVEALPPPAARAGEGAVRAVIGPENRLEMLRLCCAHAMNMFAWYFIFNWAPTWIAELTGSAKQGVAYSLYVGLGGIVGGVATGAVAGRVGVRRMMLMTMFAVAILTALFGVMPPNPALLVVSGFLLGAALFGSAVGCWLTIAYAFPPHLRATGLGIGTTAGRVGSIFGPLTAGYLLAAGMDKMWICVLLALPAIGSALTFATARRVEPETAIRR